MAKGISHAVWTNLESVHGVSLTQNQFVCSWGRRVISPVKTEVELLQAWREGTRPLSSGSSWDLGPISSVATNALGLQLVEKEVNCRPDEQPPAHLG